MNQELLPGAQRADWDIRRIVEELRRIRDGWRRERERSVDSGGREFPSRDALAEVVRTLSGALFPMRLGPLDLRHEVEDCYVGHAIDTALTRLLGQVDLELRHAARLHARGEGGEDAPEPRAVAIVRTLAGALPGIRVMLDADVVAAWEGDPAARSVDEVLLCYPGLLALIHHRIAHVLYLEGAPLVARIVAELAHGMTGIDIHPGAVIGSRLFIDHGTGVVIGETARIGERVRIYQAVTLGARSFPESEPGVLAKGLTRHPTVEDDVVIYAGATILGPVTIGRGSTIGGNVWLTHSVPPGSFVTQAHSRHESATHEGP